MKFEIIPSRRAKLGEGVSYSAKTGIISWVDILNSKVFVYDFQSTSAKIFDGFEFPSCTFQNDKGEIFVSHQGGVDRLGIQAPNESENVLKFTPPPNFRFNDGFMLDDEYLWLSTMPISKMESPGALLFFKKSSQIPTVLCSDISIPNSIVYDSVFRRLYYADSEKNEIFFLDDPLSNSGIPHIKRFTHGGAGVPDGSAVDEMGNLWNCRWGASCIQVLSPNGELLKTIEVPFKFPTSCIIMWADNSLIVTSAYSDECEYGGLTVKIDMKG